MTSAIHVMPVAAKILDVLRTFDKIFFSGADSLSDHSPQHKLYSVKMKNATFKIKIGAVGTIIYSIIPSLLRKHDSLPMVKIKFKGFVKNTV